MKTSLHKMIIAAALVSGAAVLNGCSKSDAINDISSPNAASLVAPNGSRDMSSPTIYNRNLMVTYATADGKDISSSYTGYVVNFQNNGGDGGLVTVTDAQGNTETGKWAVNSSGTRNSMSVSFGNTGIQYSFLSKDWTITKSSDTMVVMTSGTSTTSTSDAGGSSSEIHFTNAM
jgi:hypothetical protein